MRLQVGRGIDEFVDIFLRGLQENEATEDAVCIGSSVGGVAEATAKELVRVEGSDEGFVVVETLGIDIVKPLTELIHFEVGHDMPAGDSVVGGGGK